MHDKRLLGYGLISLFLVAQGCSGGDSPTIPGDTSATPLPQAAASWTSPSGAPQYSFTPGGDSLVALFHLEVDPTTLTATATPVLNRHGAAQPPQAQSYDLDIANFLRPNSFQVAGVSRDGDGDLQVAFVHRHPFPAPNFANPITGVNRADLSYTGRLLILADGNPTSFFSGAVTANTGAIKLADGYLNPGDLLAATGLTNNTFPFVLLADDGENNRVGEDNGGNPQGSYSAAAGGWQRSNIGPNNTGWTGYDYMHGGQTITNDLTIYASAFAGGSFDLDVAILIKYTDPRGAGGKTLRFPPATADVLQFAYRLPYAAADGNRVDLDQSVYMIDATPAATSNVQLALRDWDAGATEAADAVLGDEPDVQLIEPGAAGFATCDIDAPFLAAAPVAVLPGGGATGEPGDEVIYAGVLTNDLGTAAQGDYTALARFTDPADATDESAYHFGVDPLTIIPDPARVLERVTYQAVPVRVGVALLPPTIISVTPTGPAGGVGDPVVFSATTGGGAPTSWSWNFGGRTTPNLSTAAMPNVNLSLTANTYNGTVTATNAAGSSAPFPFMFTVAAAWAIHDVDKDAIQNRGWQGTADMYDGKPIIVAYQMDPPPAGATLTVVRVSIANVAAPDDPTDWTSYTLTSFTSATVNDSHPTVLVNNNRLMIVYTDSGTVPPSLRAAVATANAPFVPTASDWTFHTIDATGSGFLNNYVMHNGQLCLTYRGTSGGVNRAAFARATTNPPLATGNWALSDVENIPGQALSIYSALTTFMDAGSPRLATIYRNSTTNELRFARTNVDPPVGVASWAKHTVSGVPGVQPVAAIYVEMTVLDPTGTPRFLAMSNSFDQLSSITAGPQLFISNGIAPTNVSDWTAILFNDQYVVGDNGSTFHPDVIVHNGRIALAYTKVNTIGFGEAWLAYANNTNPTSTADFTLYPVDSMAVSEIGGINAQGSFSNLVNLTNGNLGYAYRYGKNYSAAGLSMRWAERTLPFP